MSKINGECAIPLKKRELVDQPYKIRKIAFDTNIPINIANYFQLISRGGANEKGAYALALDSYTVGTLVVAEGINIQSIGIKLVEREFVRNDKRLLPLYRMLCQGEILKPGNGGRKLAKAYERELGLDPPDAAILAITTIGKIDVFLTWNRKHLANESKRNEIEEFNRKKGLSTPLICTPTDFLDHLRISRGTKIKSLSVSRTPVLPKDRLRIFPSK